MSKEGVKFWVVFSPFILIAIFTGLWIIPLLVFCVACVLALLIAW